jgi:pre-mRNA cleavage complex 2 protein Pcf11
MPKLRLAMQTILDDLQSDVEDELEKVSLERLASIDADLLVKIKRTAEDSLRNGGAAMVGSPSKATPATEEKLSFLVDTRPPESIDRSKAWAKVKIDFTKESHDMIAALRHVVMDGSKSESTYTRKEAIDMTNTLGAAGGMATILTTALERIRDDEKKTSSSTLSGTSGNTGSASGPGARGFFAIDKSLFTNDGLKKKNMAVIGLLYEIGLPFVSSADGKRFSTQLELSNHLDSLFKKK